MSSAEVKLSCRDYAACVPGAVWLSDIPWHLYGRMLMPLCMPHIPFEVNRQEVRDALSQHNALLACWTTDWDSFDESNWWWVVCDSAEYDIERVSSAGERKSIRRGLRRCSVRRIEVSEFAPLAYPIYQTALRGYGTRPPEATRFAEDVDRWASYPGTEFWGAFHEGKMGAYVVCRVIDGAVAMISSKSDPELHKHKPNAALFYTLSRYYLRDGLQYITGGSRALLHPTAIQDFLEKLGFRKAFCRVNVELSPMARIADRSRIVQWGTYLGLRNLFGPRWRQLEGLDKLMRIASSFE